MDISAPLGRFLVEKGDHIPGGPGVPAQNFCGINSNQETEVPKVVLGGCPGYQEVIVSSGGDGEFKGGVVSCPAVVIPGHKKLVVN